MRGADISQNALFVTATVENFVPLDHPLRALRNLIDEALKDLDGLFESIYAEAGRKSIPPERLVRALLLQVLYTIRSERQLVEQVRYNMLYRWFVGLTMDEAVWSHSTFSKNRDRLLAHDVVGELFETVVEMARTRGLLSEEHFSVDGTLIQAWASQKSFRPKDEGPGGTGRNEERDFRGEERKNDTHHSVTDPDARLYRKSQGTGAILCYQGHSVMENRHGLIAQAKVSHASGTAERDTALALLRALPGKRRKTVGGDKGYDVESFVRGCRDERITVHVAAKKKGSAIDRRTQRHAGYAVSQKIRKRIEEAFGWNKSIGTLRQVKQRGLARVDALFQFGMLSWNLVRMRNILALNAATG
ncbi:MAG: transposase [Candidatus Muproteobacteria bacterium RBG_16_65_34]|uniref:Transposase n=1 Tax=Candidatus Muproteobacteria bacterium RBG_16_65_34 TaxID=1817760 RepID=A0A1F6TKP1_9PROT|nr:MAG: transposase [Candidatus Muproteobacteria bacterium RBG_16_65_34]